jgi:RHS repeat-associated protein
MTYDNLTGKYYCVNRYYDPDMGIFISPDPLLFADGYNFYTYAKNNPVMLTDRLGLKSSLIEEIQFLIGKGQIRAAAEKLTQEIKKSCDKINFDCKSRKCVAGVINPNCKKTEKCYELYRKALEYDKKINSECAKAAAIGTLTGTAQGLLNTVNGVQDGAVSTANLALGIWNNSGALICDKELGYIDSPDWSKDVIVIESDIAHEVSKFLGGQGAITLVTAGTGSGSAVKTAQEGIYEFTASSGKTYVGQSSNIPQRLIQHINNGKLLAKDVQTVKTTTVTGGKVAREIAEQTRIDRLGGIKNLENVRNPIGPARSYLLKK